MKRIVLLFLSSILFSIPISARLLDPSEIFYLAEINDYKAICRSFDNDHAISIEDAQRFLTEVSRTIEFQYSSHISVEELKSRIIEIIQKHVIGKKYFKDLEPILVITIDRLLSSEKIFPVILTKSPFKKPTSEIEVPSCLVFGGTEIVCGALLWLTPFKPLGLLLISDGVRRIDNAVDEKDKELREHPERQYHPPPYKYR